MLLSSLVSCQFVRSGSVNVLLFILSELWFRVVPSGGIFLLLSESVSDIFFIFFRRHVSWFGWSNNSSSVLSWLLVRNGNTGQELVILSFSSVVDSSGGIRDNASALALILPALYITSYSYSASFSLYHTKRDVGSFTECSQTNGLWSVTNLHFCP